MGFIVKLNLELRQRILNRERFDVAMSLDITRWPVANDAPLEVIVEDAVLVNLGSRFR